MKIFSTSDIKDIDKYTIEHEPISSTNLMERAASSVACEIISRWRPNKRMVVFPDFDNGTPKSKFGWK